MDEDLGEEDNKVASKEDLEKGEREEARGKSIFDYGNNILNLANRKVTDLKENRDVKLPDALQISEEVKLSLRLDGFRKSYSDYMRENCSDRGDQKWNLTDSQIMGLISLKKRVKEGEIVILKTDKSGKMCVCSREKYQEMGNVHTAGDDVIFEQEAEAIQSNLNAHCTMLCKMFKVG